MPDSKGSCSLTGAQGDSTIAFAYIKVLKTRKKRFFVLKSVPKASPWELECSKPPLDYHLYMYKNEKSYQKNDIKHVYNLSSVMLLSRCTKKDNSTVLGICFQEDPLYLKFSSEDELNRWYFHLSEIYNVKRNCRWPELLHCFSVTLKPKELASPSARHGKSDLAGQYRFCLTDSAVLLIRDSLLSPALSLPFRCMRSLAHSVSATFFQIHLGRLSPIGEGLLHFEVEQSWMLKEVTETLLRCLSEASSRGLPDQIPNRSGRRPSRDSVQRTSSFQTVLRRGGSVKNASQHETKSMSTFSERAPSGTYSSCLTDSQRTHSQPLNENFDDYCDLSKDANPAIDTSQSLNSSTSLSVNSEVVGADYMLTTVGQPQQQTHQLPPAQQRLAGLGAEDPLSVARIANWRFDGSDASRTPGGSGSPALGSRANSIGCRPPISCSRLGSYLPSSYSVPSAYCGEVSQTGGHRDDRQVFVEVAFSRPRTTSDASKYRAMGGGSRFRPRTGSYGNRANRLAPTLSLPDDATDDIGLASGGEQLQSLLEAGCSSKEDDPYVPMSLGSASGSRQQGAGAESPQEIEEEDPYWVNPTSLDRMIGPATSLSQQCTVEH